MTARRWAALWVGLAAPLGASVAMAQATAPAQQVEVTADKPDDTEQRRREPVAKTIYGREEIDKYGDTNLSDVLKRLPGVNVSGGNPRLRGLGAGYTLILVNGEPAPPGFSLDNLSPSQVERIEVTKGPTAEHSAQAVAGTINIILREAPRQRQREVKLGVSFLKTRLTPWINASYGDRMGDLSLSLPISGYQWRSGFPSTEERVSRDVASQPLHVFSENETRSWGNGLNFSPRLSWKLSDTDSLNWQTFAQNHNFHNAGRNRVDVLEGLAPISVDDQWTNGGQWQMLRTNVQLVRRWADGARVDVKLGAQATRSWYRTDVDGTDGRGSHTLSRISTGDNREHNWTSSGKYSRPLWDRHSLALGWDLERRHRSEVRSVIENGASQLLGLDGEPFKADIGREALYIQDEWEIAPQWSTYIGLRGERIGTASAGTGEALSNSSTVVTPLWHLNYKLDPKGRDLIRASLTRSYKAPEASALLARPSINASYPASTANPEISPDRLGNPALRPELATGLDVAFEKYFSGGGLMSLGLFHRRIDGLMRNVVSLQNVPWAAVPRWVSQPVNLARARSTGVEIEIKGRAGELMPSVFEAAMALSVRASLSAYRSSVDGIPGPDNRLEQQQPWSLTMGFDHVVKGMPLTYGVSLAYTPAYAVQQTTAQMYEQGRARNLDAYALWAFDKLTSLRLGVNNISPLDGYNRTLVMGAGGDLQSTVARRGNLANVSAGLTVKF
ncbi:MAG: TonB-dependent receptor [Ideonella sp.]|nr:TonB-dependent receptor [Ideonella sp.]